MHGLEHFEASGARQLLDTWRARPEFATDPAVRAQALADVRKAILQHPVDPAVLAAVTQWSGSQRLGMATTAGFMALGAVLLLGVREGRTGQG